MDAFGHVNHAKMVTIIEEARVELLFTEAARRGNMDMARGMVVAKLSVDYVSPLVVGDGSVRIELSVRDLRAASFVIDYTVHNGRSENSEVVARAETLMVPYNLDRAAPRRLSEDERDFLAGWFVGTKQVRETHA
jgi:acyl-CoA thioester hydrolase